MGSRISRALITGASSGLGEEFARQLAARGVDLVLVARRRDRLEAVAAELPVDVEVLPADLTDPGQRATVEARLAAADGPVDLLVNNAGFGAYGPFVDIPVDRYGQMLELNVVALTRLAHAVLPGLLARDRGGIINVASTAAFQPDPFGATYGATKAYVRSLSEALYEEVRGSGVHIMAFCPGVTSTEFQDAAGIDASDVPLGVTMACSPVVAAGLADFARGRVVSVPGLLNRLGALSAELAPSAVSRRASALFHRRLAG